MNATDVDSSFHHNFFDISQSHHRKVRVCKGSNKKSFAFKLFQFCDSKTQQRYILQEVNISKKELSSLVESLRDFLKTFRKRASAYNFHYGKAKMGLNLKSQQTIFLIISMTLSLNIQINIFVYGSDLEKANLASFPPKLLNYRVIGSYLR